MTRILRTTVLLLALLFGSVAAPAAFGATHTDTPAASTANSSSVSHATSMTQAPKGAAPAAVTRPYAPAASYTCSFWWNPYPYQINFSCTVYSGYLNLVGYCYDGSTIPTGWFGVGSWTGYIRCGSGIQQAILYTSG